MRTGAPSGEWFTALSIRLANTRSTWAASARTSGRSSGSSISTGCSSPRTARTWAAATDTTSRRSHQSVCGWTAPASMRDRSSRSPTMRARRVRLVLDDRQQVLAVGVGQRALAQAAGGGGDRRERRAEVVRDGVEHGGLGHVRAARGLRLGRRGWPPARARARRARACRAPRRAAPRPRAPSPRPCARRASPSPRPWVGAPRARRASATAPGSCSPGSRPRTRAAAAPPRCARRPAPPPRPWPPAPPRARARWPARARFSASAARARASAASRPTTSAATRKTTSAAASRECEISSRWRGVTKKKLSARTLPIAVITAAVPPRRTATNSTASR